MDKGLFIALEGGEGSGKSTLIQTMSEAFQSHGHEVVVLREPGGTAFAEDLRRVFLAHDNLTAESAALLMNAARTDNIDKIIRPALKAGKIVITDRFSGSSLVYQGIRKDAYTVVDSITRHIPMVTLFMDVPPEIGLARIAQNNRETNRLDGLPIEEHRVIYEGYQTLPSLKPDIYWDIVLDAKKTMEELNNQVNNDLVPFMVNQLAMGHDTQQTKEALRHYATTKAKLPA